MTYETISESDFGLNPTYLPFNPNLFVDITEYLDYKLNLLSIYTSEISIIPFLVVLRLSAPYPIKGCADGC